MPAIFTLSNFRQPKAIHRRLMYAISKELWQETLVNTLQFTFSGLHVQIDSKQLCLDRFRNRLDSVNPDLLGA